MDEKKSGGRWGRRALGALVVVLAGGLAFVGWKWQTRDRVDWGAVFEANNRGVGLMEQFRYDEAVPAFEEVVRLAPDWLPARINLGIALLNDGAEHPESTARARQVFGEVLKKEPDNLHGHFCLGILDREAGDRQAAAGHFEAVLRKDPGDASTWYWLGIVSEDEQKAEDCYRQALELQPALGPAMWGMGQLRMRQGKQEQGRALLERQTTLKNTGNEVLASIAYARMGRYGDVIGRRPDPNAPRTGPLPPFKQGILDVELAPGARWATAADFGKDAVGRLRARVRERFGATVVVLDFDGDGLPDLYLAGAVMDKGGVRDLLLRQKEKKHFIDVTAAAGLAAPHPTLGCCVADWDNDGKPDLILTGAGSQKLLRNNGGTFEDVSARAGLDKVKSVCLGAAFIDLDQDADLDLLLAEYAPTPEEAIAGLDGGKAAGRLLVFLNMDEVTYLDRLQLAVIDQPAVMRVYPDERFSTGPPPSQELIAFDREIHPVAARDHHGRDVTETLRRRDRLTVEGFARRSWIGFAEEHSVELDFADRLAAFGPGEKLYLCLAGWTDYATPASIWAAHQAGVEMMPPVLERQGEDGRWDSLGEAGFPAGLPRMMLVEMTGKLCGPRCRLRLRTNLHVFWDQAFVAAGCRVVRPSAVLEMASAALEPCGVMQEFSPDGRQPTLYDHDRCARVPMSPPAGRRTRFGDVTELLKDRDDRFVVFGPGDGLTVRFDAAKLPPLPAGWQRSFVLRTWGYCKDSSPFTAIGETIEPLPFAGMRNYPPAPGEHYPQDALHADYLRRYQTRE